VLTLVILVFSLLTSIFQVSGALPQVNTQATSQWTGDSVQQMVISQNVTSNDATGYVGAFNMQLKIAGQLFNIVLGTLVVAVPICNLFGWSPIIVLIAGSIQTVLYVLVAYDLLYLYKSVPW
jgi:hypothetical protein